MPFFLRRARAASQLFAAAALFALPSCSSSDPAEAPTRTGLVSGNDTWTNGLRLNGNIVIGKNATVQIPAGAKITCSEGSTITIDGTLQVAGGGRRATISCARWGGIVVQAGGAIDAVGLDLENARVGLLLREGARDSRFEEGDIRTSVNPFVVGPKVSFTLKNVKATTPPELGTDVDNTVCGSKTASCALVYGKLTASRLDYDQQGHEGILVLDDGEATIEDSFLHGTNSPGEAIWSIKGKRVTVRYTKMSGVHCGTHFEPVGSFELDHVQMEKNTYGARMFGSSAPSVIKDSNIFGSLVLDLEMYGQNAEITLQNVYTSGKENYQDGQPKKSGTPTAPVPGTGPR